MDNHTKEQRHKNMSRIKSKDSVIEITLRKALWHKGYRYRKNYSKLPGKPDIVLPKYKIVIFCDSEFFHGKDWENLKQQLQKSDNSEFWIKKIAKNVERDREVDLELAALGWTVVRFWGKDIKKHTDECVKAIDELVFSASVNDINPYTEYL